MKKKLKEAVVGAAYIIGGLIALAVIGMVLYYRWRVFLFYMRH